jgi:hypothetical protein
LQKKVENLQKKTDLMAANFSTLRAANLGASNFAAASFDSALAERFGEIVPASTPEAAISVLQNVLDGTATHPKRYHAPCDLVMKTGANAIVALNAAGSPFSAGDLIYIVTPMNAAYKGGAVFSVTPGSAAYELVSYLTPDRDPEEIGFGTSTLFTELSVCAPTVVGGTTVSTAQIIHSQGIVSSSPLAIRAGKLYAATAEREAPMQVIGPEKKRLVAFNALEAENTNRRRSNFDAYNLGLVEVPNASNQSTSAAAGGAQPAEYYSASFGGLGAPSLYANGYPSGTSTVTIVGTTGSPQTIWKFSTASEYMRHLLYGRLRISGSVYFEQTNFADAFIVRATITTCGGIIYERDSMLGMGGTTASTVFSHRPFDFAFDDQHSSGLAGDFIKDIEIKMFRTGGVGFGYVVCSENNVKLDCYEVPANERYLVHQLAGAQPAAQLGITLNTHTQVELSPLAASSAYVQPTDDLPYDGEFLPALLKYHTLRSHDAYSAGSFSKFLKKAIKVVPKVLPGAIQTVQGVLSRNPAAAMAGGMGVLKQFNSASLRASSFAQETAERLCESPPFRASSFERVEVTCSPKSQPHLLFREDRSPAEFQERVGDFLGRVLRSAADGSSLSASDVRKLVREYYVESPSERGLGISCVAILGGEPVAAAQTGKFLDMLEACGPTRRLTRCNAMPTEEIENLVAAVLADPQCCQLPFETCASSARATEARYSTQTQPSSRLACERDIPIRAAGFGNGISRNAGTGARFSFPAVRDVGDDVEYAIIPVRDNPMQVDPALAALFNHPSGTSNIQFEGRSGTLAMLLATLAKAGIPVRGGVYTGEVRSDGIVHVGDDMADFGFDILPIDHMAEKFAAVPGLSGLSPDGWIWHGQPVPFDPLKIFPGVDVRSDSFVEDGFPGTSHHVTLRVPKRALHAFR